MLEEETGAFAGTAEIMGGAKRLQLRLSLQPISFPDGSVVGKLELCRLTPDSSAAALYRQEGEDILKALSSDKYLCRPGECAGFLLKHSTGNYSKGSEVDVPLSYADYYYMEALYRYTQLKSSVK